MSVTVVIRDLHGDYHATRCDGASGRRGGVATRVECALDFADSLGFEPGEEFEYGESPHRDVGLARLRPDDVTWFGRLEMPECDHRFHQTHGDVVECVNCGAEPDGVTDDYDADHERSYGPTRTRGLGSVRGRGLGSDSGYNERVVDEARDEARRWVGPVLRGDVSPTTAWDMSSVGYPYMSVATASHARKAFLDEIARRTRGRW